MNKNFFRFFFILTVLYLNVEKLCWFKVKKTITKTKKTGVNASGLSLGYCKIYYSTLCYGLGESEFNTKYFLESEKLCY